MTAFEWVPAETGVGTPPAFEWLGQAEPSQLAMIAAVTAWMREVTTICPDKLSDLSFLQVAFAAAPTMANFESFQKAIIDACPEALKKTSACPEGMVRNEVPPYDCKMPPEPPAPAPPTPAPPGPTPPAPGPPPAPPPPTEKKAEKKTDYTPFYVFGGLLAVAVAIAFRPTG